MRFVKVLDETGKAYVKLDLEGETLPEMSFDYSRLLEFRIETYQVLKANAGEEHWNMVFGTTHAFLKTMTPTERQDFATMLVYMHYEIITRLSPDIDINGKILTELETLLSDTLAAFDQETNLVNRLIEFTENNIPIQSFQGVGERPQDSVDMTFFRDDVVRLTAVVLLCKLMAPIFGVFIESCKKRIDNAYKEVHCVAILKSILDNRCYALTNKLNHFITKIIKPMINKVKLTHVYNGFTFSVIVQQIYASMLSRRFIAVDLYKPGGNLITYVTSCARAAAQTQFSSTGFKTAVAEIIPPKEQASEEDGNVSNLEAESRSSCKTADFAILIRAAVRQLQNLFVIEHDLDAELIENAKAFYDVNHVSLTPCNSYLMGVLFSNHLCGAKSIEMLDGPSLNALIPILQVYLIQQGYHELVHVVSARPTGQLKEFPTGNDSQLRATWNNNFEYRNCDRKFPFMVNDIRWDTGLQNTVELFTTERFIVNTAPAIYELLGCDNINGSDLIVSENLSRSICAILDDQVS